MKSLCIMLIALAAVDAGLRAEVQQTAAAPAALPDAAQLSAETALPMLSTELKGRFNLSGDFDIDFASPWTPPSRTAHVWRISVVEYPSVVASSMVVRYRAYADGEALPEATVALRASLWRDVWFTREPLQAGTALDSGLVEAKRVDVFRVRDVVAADNRNPDLIVTHEVPAGSPLTWKDVGHRPLVRKGEIVEVAATTGLLRISMKALALQSGALGDIVNVRNPESLKLIPAVVVGENRVEVRL